jgi:RNA polymerase sigma-70 factor (ECF subfamily)
VNAPGKAIEAGTTDGAFDFETFFHVHYERIARAIVRVVRDPARAEEIAVEVFWRFWRNPKLARSDRAGGWLHRTAVRMALERASETVPPSPPRKPPGDPAAV